MSFGELIWRAQSALRDFSDRARVPLGLLPSQADVADHETGTGSDLRLTDVATAEWSQSSATRHESAWMTRVRERAERIRQHRLSFFDLVDIELGDPIRWNFDYARGESTPTRFSPSIDYRDYLVTGDCKVVWEPSRHHQLVVLGRAYRATGDERFAHAVAAQIGSWIDQCPFGYGMQWRSPLELAIRAINWVWAYDLIRDSKAFDGADLDRFLHSLYLHAWDIQRKFSRGSSANNHVIGEAAGVFIVTSYFPQFRHADAWREDSATLLEQAILAQTYDDGGGREQAFGYHGFVLQFFVSAGIVARRTGRDFSSRYWARVEKMIEYACRLLEGGPPPTFGDADSGYVLDVGASPADLGDMMAVGAVLFNRPDFKAVARDNREAVRWLLGRDGLAQYDALPSPPDHPLESVALAPSGYYLLQAGRRASTDRLSVLFDCGELGYGAIAAHGHADALSFTVRAFGEDLLVDPGTYDYFTYPEWRRYFRGTAAHNTVLVDGLDQSTMLGLFLWGQRAHARCLEWQSESGRVTVVGEHDGYSRLADPVRHRRTLELDAAARVLTITDELHASSRHDIALHFHLAAQCRIEPDASGAFVIRGHLGDATLTIDPALRTAVLHGSTSPVGGWVSRGYHQKTASSSLVASAPLSGTARFVCRLAIGAPVSTAESEGISARHHG
jgi:hypothetical protein